MSRASGGSDILVPYLYVVGANQAHNAFPVTDSAGLGLAGEGATRYVAGKFVDRNGAPVPSLPVEFAVREGDARIDSADSATDEFGVARARVEYGASPGAQVVVASAGGFEIPFRFEADVERPTIDKVSNSASLDSSRPVAPGALVTVFGSGFAQFEGEAPPTPLPLALKSVSASFDFPEMNLSVPAPVFYAHSNPVGLQVPWELAGLNFAYLKVRVLDRSGFDFASDPVVVELADVAPGILALDTADGLVPALQHPDGSLVSAVAPARAGGAVTILMTGNGPLERPASTGTAATEPNPIAHAPSVTLDGVPAAVAYAGSISGVAGMSQVEIAVPGDAPAGDLELKVTVHGATSNAVTLPVR